MVRVVQENFVHKILIKKVSKFQGDAGGAEDKQQDCDQFNARQFQVSFIFP